MRAIAIAILVAACGRDPRATAPSPTTQATLRAPPPPRVDRPELPPRDQLGALTIDLTQPMHLESTIYADSLFADELSRPQAPSPKPKAQSPKPNLQVPAE